MGLEVDYDAYTDLAQIRFGLPLTGDSETVSLARVDSDGEVYAEAVSVMTLVFSDDGTLKRLDVERATAVLSRALIVPHVEGRQREAECMGVTYSSSSNCAYISLAPRDAASNLDTLSLAEVDCEGHEVHAAAGPWVTFDFTPDGMLAGIEVLLASHFLPAELLADAEPV